MKNESVVVLRNEQVKVLVRRRTSASEMQTTKDYCRCAERWKYIPELENSNLTMTHVELGMHLGSEHWHCTRSTFVCAERITKGTDEELDYTSFGGIVDQSRGVRINVIED
ncbi:hypothetical protein FF2_035930 [Malus domestica]